MNAAQTKAMFSVISDVTEERLRQHQKWGEQDLPLWKVDPAFKEMAKFVKEDCNYAIEHNKLGWIHILSEEFYEVLAENDPEKLRAELVQLAAVAVQVAEYIDRKKNENA
jgi:hypothetical protein